MMSWLLPSVIATMSGTALLSFLYFYLYMQDRKKYLAVWALSWSIYFTRYVFMLWIISGGQNAILLLANQSASLLSGIMLLWGAYLFMDKKFPRVWIYSCGVGFIWIVVSVSWKLPFLIMSIPTFSFLAVVYIVTGITFLMHRITKGHESALTGWAFVVWGIHKADYPFLRPVLWIAPFGYLFTAILEFIVAFGILLVYFRKARNDLKNEKYFLQKAQEIGQIGTWELNIEKNELLWTDEEYRIFGLPIGTKLTYETFLNRVHPDDREYVDKEWKSAFDKKPYDIEHRLLVNGKIKWVREKAELYFDKRGKCTRGTGFTQDITDRKHAEEALRESEGFLKTLIDAIPTPIFYKGRDGKYLGFNKAFETFLGESKERLIGMSVFDVNPPELAEIYHVQDDELFKKGGMQRYESQWKNARGELRDIIFNKAVFADRKGAVAGLIGIIMDITERKVTEHALRESEEKFRLAFSSSPDAININRLRDGLYLDINDGFTELTGFTREDVAGKTSFDINIWHDPGDRMKLVRELKENGFCDNLEAQFRRKDGSLTTALMSARAISLNGEPHIISITRDISERKRAEAERERLLLAIEQANESIAITDVSGTIQYVNPAFEKITGYSAGEAIGETPRLLNSDRQDRSFYQDLWSTIVAGNPWSGRLVNKRKNSSLYTAECSISPVKDGKGNVISFVWISYDISNELELEKRISQAQKMEAIGTLAGGIAHDFNNILFPIIGYTEMLIDEAAENSTTHDWLKVILNSSMRARDLVRQILTFSRRQKQTLEPLRAGIIVKEALKLMRASLPSTIEMDLDIAKDCGLILADPTNIHQIIMNLCTNAYHAMEESGGRLGVILSRVEWTQEDVVGLDREAGPYLCLKVEDTGHGMEREVMDRIFDPYFTTKEKNKGTGLGLAVVHGIVHSYGGEIRVRSELGAGTVFEVFLPLIKTEAPALEIESASDLPAGDERILVVDDEASIVQLIEKMLGQLGYAVTACTGSSEALLAYSKGSRSLRPGDYGHDHAPHDRRQDGLGNDENPS